MTDRQWQNFVTAVREIVEQAPHHPNGWRGVKDELMSRMKHQDDFMLEEFFSWFGVDPETEVDVRK